MAKPKYRMMDYDYETGRMRKRLPTLTKKEWASLRVDTRPWGKTQRKALAKLKKIRIALEGGT